MVILLKMFKDPGNCYEILFSYCVSPYVIKYNFIPKFSTVLKSAFRKHSFKGLSAATSVTDSKPCTYIVQYKPTKCTFVELIF